MKQKRLFKITLGLVILVMSIVVVTAYDYVKPDPRYVDDNDYSNFVIDLPLIVLDQAKKKDSNYEPLTFVDMRSEIRQETIRTKLDTFIEEQTSNLYKDSNFKILQSDSKEELQNFVSNSLYYVVVQFDEQGQIAYLDSNNYMISDTSILDKDRILSFEDMLQSEKNSTTINRPQNLGIAIKVPEKLVGETGLIYDEVMGSMLNYTSLIIVISIVICVLILFILFAPISTVKTVHPYKTITRYKGECIALVLGATLIGGVYLLSGLISITIRKDLQSAINIPNAEQWIYVMNVAAWALYLYIVTMAIFAIKNIIDIGIFKYIREHTVISVVCALAIKMGRCIVRFLKRIFVSITTVDINKPVYKVIRNLVIINFIVSIILCIFGPAGIFIAIIYNITIFFWLYKKIQKMYNDYTVLLDAVEALGQGDITKEITVDIGIFNSIKESFERIQVGLETAVAEQTKSQNLKTELITNVSHDLKTPLTCISNYVELLQDSSIEEEKRKEYIQNLAIYSKRLEVLIEDLFMVSKVNSGNVELDIVALNIVSLLEQVYVEHQESFTKRNLQMIYTTTSPEIVLPLDGNKTQRIFDNLFGNIEKYAMPNTRVYVDIKEEEHFVDIQIKNISEQPMNFSAEEVVERFVRGDSSRHASGSGLGLAIVQSFTEIQKGKVRIEIDGDLFKVTVRFFKP